MAVGISMLKNIFLLHTKCKHIAMLNNTFPLHIELQSYHLKYPMCYDKYHRVSKISLRKVTHVDE
jgi:hypothetical protein